MRCWNNRPIPAPPLVEKALEFTGISRVFPIKGRFAMTWYPNSYGEKNSLKPGKIASKRTRPTFGSSPLGRSRPPANRQSPLRTKLPTVASPTSLREALGPTQRSGWEALLRPRPCPQNTATPTATQQAAFRVCRLQSLFFAKVSSRFHGRVVESLRGQSVKGLLISPTQMEGDA